MSALLFHMDKLYHMLYNIVRNLLLRQELLLEREYVYYDKDRIL